MREKLLALTVFCSFCSGQIPTGVDFEPLYDTKRISFVQPTWVGGIPGHPNQLLVIERNGTVSRLFLNGRKTEKKTFLRVNANTSTHWDGAWAIAFHPAYIKNRLFYLLYREKAKQNPIGHRGVENR